MSAEKTPGIPLFPQASETGPPSAEAILFFLAQTLSVAKTLKRFPSLKPGDLQAILERCARHTEGKKAAPPPPPTSREEGPKQLYIYADGASRGNPGESGIGAVLADGRGKTVKELKFFLGNATNNVAEYRAVLLALEKALDLGAESVIINLDSELVVRQILGEYKVREAHLQPLHRQVLERLQKFSRYRIQHIPREENRRADQLANEAIDQRVRGV